MRVAVLSDVHGNADSLRAVLDDVDRWGPNLLVNAGDVAAHGPGPEEAAEMLRSREVLHVRGNNDRYLATECASGPPGRDDADTAERAPPLSGPARGWDPRRWHSWGRCHPGRRSTA